MAITFYGYSISITKSIKDVQIHISFVYGLELMKITWLKKFQINLQLIRNSDKKMANSSGKFKFSFAGIINFFFLLI